MQIVIATDGGLDADQAADLAARLVEPGDSVAVATVVEVPRTLLLDLRALYVMPQSQPRIESGEEYVTQPAGMVSAQWPGDDAMIARYVDDQTRKRTARLIDALQARGITAQVIAREGDSPTPVILALLEELEADLLCIGTHGQGRFDGLLGSTGTKLVRRSPCSVILVRQEPVQAESASR